MIKSQKNNGQDFWEILERIIGKISSIIGAGLVDLLLVLVLDKISIYISNYLRSSSSSFS